MNGYKAFTAELTCLDFRFEIGKTYEVDGSPELCKKGFHFCVKPLNVLNFYPIDSRFATVEAEECVSDGLKTCSKKITIKNEITLKELITHHIHTMGLCKNEVVNSYNCKAAVSDSNDSDALSMGSYSSAITLGRHSHALSYGFRASVMTNGEYSYAATTGDSSHAVANGSDAYAITIGRYSNAITNAYGSQARTERMNSIAIATGQRSKAVTKGQFSHAITTDIRSDSRTAGSQAHAVALGTGSSAMVETPNSIAANLGGGCAMGEIGSWLFLVEKELRPSDIEDATGMIKHAIAIKVDGEKYLPKTLYRLKNGQVIKAE